MDYEKAVNLSSNPEKALGLVREVFMHNNFRITRSDSREFEVEGPGMNNNRVNPLMGISRARITLSGRTLAIEAELGSLRRFARTMAVFLIVFAIFMAGLFSFLSWKGLFTPRSGSAPLSTPMVMLIALLPFAPWPFLLPMMIGSFRKKAIQAIDTLMENAAL